MATRKFLCPFADQCELFTGSETVGGSDRQPRLVTTFQSCDADHVELVEIRGEDGEELRTLEEWKRRILRESENA
ncbi:hypothetical protein RhoFasB10_04731 [Rhodococcus sp. B10]|nr:hypothetical protein [Rhodococcus sp. B10]